MKSKVTKISLAATAVLLVGGLVFLVLTDINVKTSQVTKTIPNERFYKTD